MWEAIDFLFTPEFIPHGHCYFWQPGLLWLTHLVAVWHGAYWLAGLLKMLTASVTTAIALWILTPRFLSSPISGGLKYEIDDKNAAVSALKEVQLNLEQRIKEGRLSLEAKNGELIKKKQRLESVQTVTVDRKLAMIELKKEVNRLLAKPDRPEKYVLSIPLVNI